MIVLISQSRFVESEFAPMIEHITILGGGSAGFLAALSVKLRLPGKTVRIIRSSDLGIIGVGEGSTKALTLFLHQYLRVDRRQFVSIAQPTWKLGLRFIWGPRPYFNYTFGPQLDSRAHPELTRSNGYFCDDDIEYTDAISALMSQDRAFESRNGKPVFHDAIAYHIENERFVQYLEMYARSLGVEIQEGTVSSVKRNETGVQSLILTDGREIAGNLFVDASGFRSELLGRAMNEPFISFDKTLFCDRAVVGGWNREAPEDELIRPYTTCETMDSGWCWQIEHEHRINRGYVYSSSFISDEAAEQEFRRKNPKIAGTRIVKFVAGRYQRSWIGNVVAIGNASGFVEPLEATALGNIAGQCINLAETLYLSDCQPRPAQITCFNRLDARNWDSVRDFLGIHYKFNTRLDTDFWRYCREHTDVAGAAGVVDYYQQLGPDGFYAQVALNSFHDQFQIGGYVTLMTGMKVPYRRTFTPTQRELQLMQGIRMQMRNAAAGGLTVNQALAAIRSSV
jgi:tryptophan halogenase